MARPVCLLVRARKTIKPRQQASVDWLGSGRFGQSIYSQDEEVARRDPTSLVFQALSPYDLIRRLQGPRLASLALHLCFGHARVLWTDTLHQRESPIDTEAVSIAFRMRAWG